MRRNQKGMASLVVTVVLISLLSAVAVAFAVIMNRELQKSVNNQLGQAAYNAAASGINDSISYLRDNPNTNITQCQDLLGPGKPLSLAADLSGNGSTKYTCVLINNSPHNIVYQSIPAGGSQVIRASLSAPTSKLMFSWQASNRAYNNFVPAIQAGQLFDETSWKSTKYTPMLKVSLYPVPADTKDAVFANTNSRTYYLYPTRPAADLSVNTLSYATAAGTLKPVECGLKNNNGQFNGNGSFDCNLIITNLPTGNPAGYMYYIRLTSLYGAADVEIRANDTSAASGEVSFVSTQAIIDVTAQSASAVKRLQARVDITGLTSNGQDIAASDNGFPEFAVRAANTVCKRIQSPASIIDFPAYIDDASIAYCGSDIATNLTSLKPPIVSVSCSAAGQNNGNCTGTVNPNNGRVTACHFSGPGPGSDCPTTPTHSTTPYSVSWNPSGLSAGTSYTVTLCASNPAGQSNPCATSSFTTDSPPPPPLGGQVITIIVSPLWNASITDNGSGAGLAQCEFYQGGNSSNPGPYLGTATIKDAYGNNIMNYGSGTSPGSPAPGGTTLIHCLGVSGVSQWSDSPPPAPASLVITNFSNAGVWDQGPECNFPNPNNPYHMYDKTWWCRNGRLPTTPPSTSPGCANGVHRWTTCWVRWSHMGGTGNVHCDASVIGYGNFDSSDLSGPGSQTHNPQTPWGWINASLVTGYMYLKCTDSTGQQAQAGPI